MPYNRLPPEAVFANTLGLLIVLFGVLVLCALAKPDWKRPEDGSTDTRQVPAALWGCTSAPRVALRSRAGGLPHPRGPNWSVPGLGWAGERRLQAHPRLPAAPARHRALMPPRSPPAVPGLPAWSSPTPLLSRLPRRLAFSGLPVPNALLSVGRHGVSCLTAETPLQWGHLFACVLVPLPASSCGVQLSPRARTGICAKSAAPEPCGAILGTSSGRKLPEERPVTGGAGSQHSTSCPSPASSAGSAGGLAACLTPRGDVCVVVGPAQQPSGTLNKALASAALLHLRPLGRPNPVPVLTPCWGRCVVPLTPWCRAGSALVPEFLFCPLSGASSTPRERSHVSLLVSPASHGAEMRARGWPSSFLPPQPSRSGLAGSPPLDMGTSRLPPAPNPTTPPLSARGQTLSQLLGTTNIHWGHWGHAAASPIASAASGSRGGGNHRPAALPQPRSPSSTARSTAAAATAPGSGCSSWAELM